MPSQEILRQAFRTPAHALMCACALLGGCAIPTTVPNPAAADRSLPAVARNDDKVVAFTYQAQYAYVRIERSEATAQLLNDHPFKEGNKVLRTFLSTLRVQGHGLDNEALFSEAELDEIAAPLATAMARATPLQEVTFAVSGKHGGLSLLRARTVTTGRMFFKSGELNIIFGLVHNAFEDQLLASGWLRPFTPGSRTGRVDTGATVFPTVGHYATADRRDWIVVPKNQLMPGGPPTPAGDSVTVPDLSDKQYEELERRLRTLNQLRKNGVITEDEYQTRRQVILKDL